MATRLPRDFAIQELQRICREQNVAIIDFHMFSNLSLAINFEAKLSEVLSSIASFRECAFKLDSESENQFEAIKNQAPGDERVGTFQISFAGQDGSLKIPVPMVPG